MGVGLFILIAAGIVVLVVVLQWQAKVKRREALAAWSAQHGLSFSALDPFPLARHYDFSFFRRGDGRGAENVLTGQWAGLRVVAADYWYYTESDDSRGRSSRTYKRFSVVIVRIDADLPGVLIERENILTRLADGLGMDDIRFESEDFNRAFNVRADDREFAYKLIDARMMAWLLAECGGVCVEVHGPDVLMWCKRLPPAELAPLLDRAKGFVDKVPRLVWAEYGKAAS